jgi:Domain of unknown function (DUF1937)
MNNSLEERDDNESSIAVQFQPGIIYLAAPYTHPDPEVRLARYKAVTHIAARLVAEGRRVFSPLTMTHPLDILMAGSSNTLGSDYWVRFDEAFMAHCSEIIIVTLEGWDASSGVAREKRFFAERGLPIRYVAPHVHDVTVNLRDEPYFAA